MNCPRCSNLLTRDYEGEIGCYACGYYVPPTPTPDATGEVNDNYRKGSTQFVLSLDGLPVEVPEDLLVGTLYSIARRKGFKISIRTVAGQQWVWRKDA